MRREYSVSRQTLAWFVDDPGSWDTMKLDDELNIIRQRFDLVLDGGFDNPTSVGTFQNNLYWCAARFSSLHFVVDLIFELALGDPNHAPSTGFGCV